MNAQQYMWEHKFKKEFALVPSNRKPVNIIKLQKIIKEMSSAGYSSVAIGGFIGKDHSTVLHHLKKDETSVGKKLERIKKAQECLQEREALRKEQEALRQQRRVLIQERIARKKKRVQERGERIIQRSKDFKLKRENAAKKREAIMVLYKKGLSYSEIGEKLGITPSSVPSVLHFHPEWKKVMRNPNQMKSVIQFSLDGKKIATFKALAHAEKATGIPRSAIVGCAKGRARTAGGFVWKYATPNN